MKPLRIVIDGYWLTDGPPSGKNVVHGIIAGWAQRYPADHVILAAPARPQVQLPDRVAVRIVRAPVRNHAAWVQTALPRAIDSTTDAVLAQNFTPILVGRRARRLTFFHDAMFVDHPEWFSALERPYLRAAGWSLRRADVVLTSSRAEATRIGRAYPNVRGRVSPVGLGIPPGLARAHAEDVPEAHEPYILSVGRLNIRKNVTRLIDAFTASTLLEGYRLLIVGAANGVSEQLNSKTERIRLLGSVSDAQLAFLYSNCDGFAFPSLDEGFGLPIIEAKRFGARMAVSRIPAFEELQVADDYFDPNDPASIRGALERLVAEKSTRTQNIPPQLTDDSDGWAPVIERIRSSITVGSSS